MQVVNDEVEDRKRIRCAATPFMTAPCARRLRDPRQASVWLAHTAREGCAFAACGLVNPLAPCRKPWRMSKSVHDDEPLFVGLAFFFKPPCGCHSDMSPKTLPTVQVVDTTHRHWSTDQRRSLPYPTVARQNMLLTAHLFAGHARRMMVKFHSCFLEKSRFTCIVSGSLHRHLQSTFCWHNTLPLADSSLSTRYSATFLWHCTCARL